MNRQMSNTVMSVYSMRMRKFLRIRLEQTGGIVNPWVSCKQFFCAEGVVDGAHGEGCELLRGTSMIGRVQ